MNDQNQQTHAETKLALLSAWVEYRDRVNKLERENAALRNEIVRLNNQTMWVCSCGGTDCAGQRENTALRAALDCIAGNCGERSPVTIIEAQEEARDALAFSKETQL